MRIACWNVNSLKARLEKVEWWIDRAEPDVILLQETKLEDANAPRDTFHKHGYALAHHGAKGGRNGVAIASRIGLENVETNFGLPLEAPRDEDAHPLGEARVIAADCGGLRVLSIYAPNGRTIDSIFFRAKLGWFEHLEQWIARTPRETLVIGGDYNVAPTDADVWDPVACHGGTHVSPEERAAFRRLLDHGLVDAYRLHHQEGDRYSWWDYRAGMFHKNHGMRIDHLLIRGALAGRVVASEIDREARKGKPVPSDHAPVLVDLDTPGKPIDAGWRSADERIAERRAKAKRP